MSAIFGQILVSAVLLGVVALAVRSLWRSHKSGGHCTGNCGSCKHCHK